MYKERKMDKIGYIDYYSGKKAIPLIVDIFNKNLINTTEDHVKIWSMPYMRYSDIMTGLSYCHRSGKKHIIYTNSVDTMIKTDFKDVTIYDISDILNLSKKVGMFFDIYDMVGGY